MTVDPSYVSEWRRADGSPARSRATEPDVVFAHASDLHGQLFARPQVYYDTDPGPPIDFGGAKRRVLDAGGIDRLAAKLRELREAAAHVLTLMSGDTFHGSAHATYTDGESMLDAVSRHVEPDVYVPGNWDFGPEGVEDGKTIELLDALDVRVLANNLFDAETEARLYDPFTIASVGEFDVGLVGMTNVYVDRMAPAYHEGKYLFGKHPALLERSARRAREAGADLVVAVTEIGLGWSVQAAKDCHAVDVICSAHTHEYTFEPLFVEDTVVIESGLGEGLGRLDVRAVDDGFEFRHVLYVLADELEYTPEPDPTARRSADDVREPFVGDDVHFERGDGTLDRSIETVVGETETPLSRQSFLESPWNTLLNDALRAHFDADLAVTHGYRYGTALPPGEITIEDLYTCFPMTGPVARGEAYGTQLRDHLEWYLIDNFSPHVYEHEDGRVRSFSSNVDVTIDPTAKRGRRLVELAVDGESVDPDASYSVASIRQPGTPERVLGGSRFPFREVTVDEGTVPVDVVSAFLEGESPIAYEGSEVVTVADGGGAVQNTPVDGPYPYVQPGVDHADGEYAETRMIPRGYSFPPEGVNRFR